MNNRKDPIPQINLEGFDDEQGVFLYGKAKTSNGQAALFFPIDEYYPDSDSSKDVPHSRILKSFREYDAYLDNLADGEGISETAPAVVGYKKVSQDIRASYYFSVVRALLSDIMDGGSPDDVFEIHAPDPADADDWADYKSAYFDATGLVALADQIDMPRMASNGGFGVFRASATVEQQATMDRFANPENFDSQGNYIAG